VVVLPLTHIDPLTHPPRIACDGAWSADQEPKRASSVTYITLSKIIFS
jgi:hypothetical protein